MGKILQPSPVKLFVAVLSSVPENDSEVEAELVRLFGSVDLRSDTYPFDFTRYYDDQMGTPIWRSFVAFQRLISPAEIASIKVETNKLEEVLSSRFRKARRPVNLDPGYVEMSKIVLASTKNFYHRILIGRGIYGEVTLYFQSGEWQSLPWTFPDFKSGHYNEFLRNLRSVYRSQLKAECQEDPTTES
jgi:hypothetical protein